ncbi:MAG: hypothetical protein ACRCXZ_01180 [Patescibacteria group bacterium]
MINKIFAHKDLKDLMKSFQSKYPDWLISDISFHNDLNQVRFRIKMSKCSMVRLDHLIFTSDSNLVALTLNETNIEDLKCWHCWPIQNQWTPFQDLDALKQYLIVYQSHIGITEILSPNEPLNHELPIKNIFELEEVQVQHLQYGLETKYSTRTLIRMMLSSYPLLNELFVDQEFSSEDGDCMKLQFQLEKFQLLKFGDDVIHHSSKRLSLVRKNLFLRRQHPILYKQGLVADCIDEDLSYIYNRSDQAVLVAFEVEDPNQKPKKVMFFELPEFKTVYRIIEPLGKIKKEGLVVDKFYTLERV